MTIFKKLNNLRNINLDNKSIRVASRYLNGNQPLGFVYEMIFPVNAIVVPAVCSYIGASTAVRANDAWDITLDTHSGKLNVTKVINTQISATLYMILIY